MKTIDADTRHAGSSWWVDLAVKARRRVLLATGLVSCLLASSTAAQSGKALPRVQAFRLVHANSKLSLMPSGHGSSDGNRTAVVASFDANNPAYSWILVRAAEAHQACTLGGAVSMTDLDIGGTARYYIVNARTGLVLTQDTSGVNVSNWGLWPRGHARDRWQLWELGFGNNDGGQIDPATGIRTYAIGQYKRKYRRGDFITIINEGTRQGLTQESWGTRRDRRNVQVAGHLSNGFKNLAYWWQLEPVSHIDLYKLVIERIRCIAPSKGQDTWTKALFKGIDFGVSALASGLRAVKGGAEMMKTGATILTRKQVFKAATNKLEEMIEEELKATLTEKAKKDLLPEEIKKLDEMVARLRMKAKEAVIPAAVLDALELADTVLSSEKLFNTVYGESPDDLQIRVNNAAVWPNGPGSSRETKSQAIHSMNVEFLFRGSTGVSIQLVEVDSPSGDDSLGYVTWKPPAGGLHDRLRLENVLVRSDSEKSLYEVTLSIEPMLVAPPEAPTAPLFAQIVPDRGLYSTTNDIVVSFSNVDGGGGEKISLCKEGSPVEWHQGERSTYIYGKSGQVTFQSLPEGSYEIRLYYHVGGGSFGLAKRSYFKVRAPVVNRPPPPDIKLEEAMRLLEQQLTQAGFSVIHRTDGTLGNGQSARVSLGAPFVKGQQYAVAAFGHPGLPQSPRCTALSVVLSDGLGNAFAKNEQADARGAVITVSPTEDRTYSATVQMTCNGGPCKWGLVVVRRAGAPATPTPKPEPVSSTPSAQLNQPVVQWDANSGNWVFLVNGQIQNASGSQGEILIEFEFLEPNSRRWVAGPGLAGEDAQARARFAQYRDAAGNAVIRQGLKVTQQPFNVGPLYLRIPHIAFHINDDPDGSVYDARARAVVIVDGKRLAWSGAAPFRLSW